MADPDELARDWVEVSEEGDGGRVVLRPQDYPIPPSRGPRRHLRLAPSGSVQSLAADARDALETKGQGHWSLNGKTLRLDLGGWEGDYEIEELGTDILILRRR